MVLDVSPIAAHANAVLEDVKNLLRDTSINEEDREKFLKELYLHTGLNDDATWAYDVVPTESVLPLLTTTIPFHDEYKAEWERLVLEQKLFRPTHRAQKVQSILLDPGRSRDWLVNSVRWFLTLPRAQVDEVNCSIVRNLSDF